MNIMPARTTSTYLLDTNACIGLINGTPSSVRANFQKKLDRNALIFVSSISTFELWYGVEKSVHRQVNTARLRTFFSGPLQPLSFDDEDARIAGALRASLEKMGKPIGAYDLLIAGQAVRHESTLVTANVREFRRIESLQWEDWAKS